MPNHTVVAGDCATSIAAEHGFPDAESLMNHPSNADLKRLRPDWNQLHPGDRVFIPEAVRPVMHLATGKRHTVVIKRPKRLLRVAFLDNEGQPLSGAYTLRAGDLQREGTLDGKGVLEELLPADLTSAEVDVAGVTRSILIGHLNPLADTGDDGVSGAQARLSNLGFGPGDVDGDAGPMTRAAILSFQAAHGLEQTGELDAATRDKLEREHGC